MAIDLRANTAVDVLIGPFVDSTDGNTDETGLTITQADVRLSKNGQNMAQKNDANACTHDELGYYNCPLDTTDSNTEGTLVLVVHEAGALQVRHEFNILSEAAWDSLYAAKDTGFMDVNIKAVSEDTTAADNLESACDNYSVTRGLTGTALPAAVADVAGGLPISDAGGLDLDTILDVAISTRLAPTTAARTLDVTATGAAGIDWANVENPTTAVDLSATDIQLCDTITTYTGDTPQTADHTAGIADIPTVAEFEARTIVSANYVVVGDTIAGVTLVATTTAVTNDVGITQAGADKAWGTAARILTASTNFNDISAADVNTQVSDVMKVDTIAEQAQGVPPTTPTFEEAVMYLYMALTKSIDVDASLKEFYNNAGAVVWKKSLSDDGTNYVEAKGASGP